VEYRRAFARHFGGLDAEVAPFISTVRAERIAPKLLRDILPENQSPLPLIPQLIGNCAEDFIRMAEAIYALGYEEINWNLGCPHKPIRKKRRGAGLLPFPDSVDAFLEKVCEESPCKISVKVRLGVASPEELFRLIPVLNHHPLTEVIIHSRTAEQMYTGQVDLDAFEQAAADLRHPVCYNGDIRDPAFFRKIRKRFPSIKRFMIGRGILENPILPHLLKADVAGNPFPDPLEVLQRLVNFHGELLEAYEARMAGDRPVLGKMKEFWSYQHHALSNGRLMFKKLKKAERLASYRVVVEEFLREARYKLFDPECPPCE
jgi:tRNA-dihydrouridine synthase